MGTEIFLKWDGMTEAETGSQVAASRRFGVSAGRLGYLRAAAGMKREGALLHLVFPLEYWYNATAEPMPFNFQLGQSALNRGAKVFLQSVRDHAVPDFKDRALVAVVGDATVNSGEGPSRTAETEGSEYETAKEWLEEVAEFFSLGAEKQDKGLNPGVLISW